MLFMRDWSLWLLFFNLLLLSFGRQISLASNSMSTINSFSPGTSQINFVSVETVKTLDHKRFSFLGFLDANYQSLALYNSSQTGNDVLSFTHLGLSYGLSPKIEIGLKGPVVFNQTSDSSQASLVLTAQGFVNLDGFIKYRLFDSVKSGLTLMAQLGVANGDEIFYVGPGSGLSSSVSVLYEKSFGSWLLAANLGFILRNPGEQESLPFFEPIQSTTLGSVGIGRPLTKKTRVSAELLLASHSFTQDNSDRESLAVETLVSLHTKMKALNLSYGLGTGLTNGISTPTLRGFLGFQYAFDLEGMRWAKKSKEEDKTGDEASAQELAETDKVLDPETESIANKGNDGVSDITVSEIEQVFIEGGKEAQVPPGPKINDVVVKEFDSNIASENLPEAKSKALEDDQGKAIAEEQAKVKDEEQSKAQEQVQANAQEVEQEKVLKEEQEKNLEEEQLKAQTEEQVKSQAETLAQLESEKEVVVEAETPSEVETQASAANQEESQKDSASIRKGAHKFILNYIKFDFDSAKLDEESINTLKMVLIEIKKQSYTSIKIWGHTDYYGSSAYNEYLGLRRAKAVYDFFEKEGLSKAIIDYDAFGERRPVSVGIAGPDRQRNRRVEIVVYRDLE